MKYKIIIMCHGALALELKASAQMIVGEQENLSAIEFKKDDSLEILAQNLDKEFKHDSTNIILTDLKGGSPFNVAFRKKYENQNVELFTGVNLPLILEIINQVNILKQNFNITNEKLTNLIEKI